MTVDEKRDVIEVLLCASGSLNDSTIDVAFTRGVDMRLVNTALAASYNRIPWILMAFADREADAAYLLIESSPTLRREWFGAA